MRRIAVLICLAGLVLAAGAVRAAEPLSVQGPPALTALVREGLAHNRELQALRKKAAALAAKAPLAGSLPDPRLGLGLLNVPVDTFDLDQEPMTQKQVSLAQAVPWFGTLDLKQRAAVLQAERQRLVNRAKEFDLAERIAVAWYELGFVAKSQQINDRLRAMVRQMLQVVEIRYATGKGLQQDILSAQVRLSELIDESIDLRRKRRILEDRINEMLSRESFTPVEPPELGGAPEFSADTDELARRALAHNPWLAVRAMEIRLAGVAVELAEKDYYPDMDFRVSYGQREPAPGGPDRPDFLTGQVFMTLPVWQGTSQDSRLEGATLDRASAEKNLEGLRRGLPHRVSALAADIRDRIKSHELVRDALVIQASQWADSSLAAYEVGSLEFDTMLEARIRRLRFELRAARSAFEARTGLAELAAVLGAPLQDAQVDPAAAPEQKIAIPNTGS